MKARLCSSRAVSTCRSASEKCMCPIARDMNCTIIPLNWQKGILLANVDYVVCFLLGISPASEV